MSFRIKASTYGGSSNELDLACDGAQRSSRHDVTRASKKSRWCLVLCTAAVVAYGLLDDFVCDTSAPCGHQQCLHPRVVCFCGQELLRDDVEHVVLLVPLASVANFLGQINVSLVIANSDVLEIGETRLMFSTMLSRNVNMWLWIGLTRRMSVCPHCGKHWRGVVGSCRDT